MVLVCGFLLNVALALAAFPGTLVFVQESFEADPPAVDVAGAVLVAVGLAVLVYNVLEAPEHGWASPPTLAGFALGFLVLLCFLGWKLSRRHPLLDP